MFCLEEFSWFYIHQQRCNLTEESEGIKYCKQYTVHTFMYYATPGFSPEFLLMCIIHLGHCGISGFCHRSMSTKELFVNYRNLLCEMVQISATVLHCIVWNVAEVLGVWHTVLGAEKETIYYNFNYLKFSIHFCFRLQMQFLFWPNRILTKPLRSWIEAST